MTGWDEPGHSFTVRPAPAGGNDEDGWDECPSWLDVPGAARREDTPRPQLKMDADVDEEALDSVGNSDGEDYDLQSLDDLTDHMPTLSQHLSGRTTLSRWTKKRFRCIFMILATLAFAGLFTLLKSNDGYQLLSAWLALDSSDEGDDVVGNNETISDWVNETDLMDIDSPANTSLTPHQQPDLS